MKAVFDLFPDLARELRHIVPAIVSDRNPPGQALRVWGRRHHLTAKWFLNQVWYDIRLRFSHPELAFAAQQGRIPELLPLPPKVDGLSEEFPAPNPYIETVAQYLQRVATEARRRYAAGVAAIPTPHRRRTTSVDPRHLEWLALRIVKKKPFYAIWKDDPKAGSPQAVAAAVRSAARTIGWPLS